MAEGRRKAPVQESAFRSADHRANKWSTLGRPWTGSGSGWSCCRPGLGLLRLDFHCVRHRVLSRRHRRPFQFALLFFFFPALFFEFFLAFLVFEVRLCQVDALLGTAGLEKIDPASSCFTGKMPRATGLVRIGLAPTADVTAFSQRSWATGGRRDVHCAAQNASAGVAWIDQPPRITWPANAWRKSRRPWHASRYA